MSVMLGGEKAWKTRSHGDIGVSFQWINDEPAMILFPSRRSIPGAGAFAICISAAWQYADSRTGAPTPYLIEQSFAAAHQLGFGSTDTYAARKIAEVIVDSLPDLVEMPPVRTGMNAAQTQAIGELKIMVDGQTTTEREITTHDLELMTQ